MPIATVFFDLGGVLLSNAWDHHERARAWARFGFSAAEAAECEARHEPPVLALERGEITLAAYLRQVVFFRPRPFTEPEFLDCMRSQSVPNPDSLALFDELATAARVQFATLNNEGRELNEYRIERFELRRRFSVFCSSCYLGVRKPDALIYHRALGIVQRAPEACLFIDDREENVAAARSLGFDAIRFETAERLRAQLRQRGLI